MGSNFICHMLILPAHDILFSLTYTNLPIHVCWNNEVVDTAVIVNYLYMTPDNLYKTESYAYNSSNVQNLNNGLLLASPMFGFNSCFTVAAIGTPIALRLKTTQPKQTVTIVPDISAQLPVQGIIITSIGEVGSIKKSVTVLKQIPTIPLEFDYALYQESTTLPLTNQ